MKFMFDFPYSEWQSGGHDGHHIAGLGINNLQLWGKASPSAAAAKLVLPADMTSPNELIVENWKKLFQSLPFAHGQQSLLWGDVLSELRYKGLVVKFGFPSAVELTKYHAEDGRVDWSFKDTHVYCKDSVESQWRLIGGGDFPRHSSGGHGKAPTVKDYSLAMPVVDLCYTNPCKNGGKCSDISKGSMGEKESLKAASGPGGNWNADQARDYDALHGKTEAECEELCLNKADCLGSSYGFIGTHTARCILSTVKVSLENRHNNGDDFNFRWKNQPSPGDTYTCECKKDFKGDNCETGPVTAYELDFSGGQCSHPIKVTRHGHRGCPGDFGDHVYLLGDGSAFEHPMGTRVYPPQPDHPKGKFRVPRNKELILVHAAKAVDMSHAGTTTELADTSGRSNWEFQESFTLSMSFLVEESGPFGRTKIWQSDKPPGQPTVHHAEGVNMLFELQSWFASQGRRELQFKVAMDGHNYLAGLNLDYGHQNDIFYNKWRHVSIHVAKDGVTFLIDGKPAVGQDYVGRKNAPDGKVFWECKDAPPVCQDGAVNLPDGPFVVSGKQWFVASPNEHEHGDTRVSAVQFKDVKLVGV
jgi:hypothetical protein